MNLFESVKSNLSDPEYSEKLLSSEDLEWLKEQGHADALENRIKNFKISKDVERDEFRLDDIASSYFYDIVGIYNNSIDKIVSNWAHDKAVELHGLTESTKTQDFINQLDIDNAALRYAGISGDTMTFDQYQKYQDYVRNARKNDTSRYDITISYWDRNGYPQEKSYVGRSLKEIAKKFVNARDKVYDYRELSDYSDNLYELLHNSICDDLDEYLEKIAAGITPESLVDLDESEDEDYQQAVESYKIKLTDDEQDFFDKHLEELKKSYEKKFNKKPLVSLGSYNNHFTGDFMKYVKDEYNSEKLTESTIIDNVDLNSTHYEVYDNKGNVKGRFQDKESAIKNAQENGLTQIRVTIHDKSIPKKEFVSYKTFNIDDSKELKALRDLEEAEGVRRGLSTYFKDIKGQNQIDSYKNKYTKSDDGFELVTDTYSVFALKNTGLSDATSGEDTRALYHAIEGFRDLVSDVTEWKPLDDFILDTSDIDIVVYGNIYNYPDAYKIDDTYGINGKYLKKAKSLLGKSCEGAIIKRGSSPVLVVRNKAGEYGMILPFRSH